jgi:signal transduction histidine kinase
VADSTDLRDIKTSRWTLAFSDPAFERHFRTSWLQATRLTTRIWVACGITFLTLFTVLLVVALPAHHQDLLRFRYLLALPIIAVSQIPMLCPVRMRRLVGPSYLCGSLTAYAMALYCFANAHFDYNIVFLVEMAATFAFCQNYGRILFPYTLAFSLIGGGATIATIVYEPALLGVPNAPVIVAIISFVLVGLFAAYTSEFFVRRSYRSMQILKAEIARSTELAEQAQAASEAKSRFLAVVGHELRTPLHAIIGFAEAIKGGILGPIGDGRIRTAVEDIHGSGQRLLGIVDDVLDLSKATTGTMALEEGVFDPSELIGELVLAFEGECAKNGLKLYPIDNPDLPRLSADRRLVQRMLSNLLSNAIRYTRPGGEIWILATAAPGEPMIIEVKDTGIGIAPELVTRAMETFGQVEDDLNRRFEGLGMGLSLTKSLIELHGGRIDVESAVGQGTRVRLVFPSERAVWSESAPEASQAGAA